LAVGDLVLDISSLRSHGDTLYLAGSVVGKILYVGIDGAATGTQIGLIDADPFTMKLMLYPDGGAVGSLVGSPSGGTPQASMIPLYISADIGLRLYTTVQSDEMVNVTYVEMTS
jgi:hypothetical protein